MRRVSVTERYAMKNRLEIKCFWFLSGLQNYLQGLGHPKFGEFDLIFF